MAYLQPVWRAGTVSNAGVRPEDSWKMPDNAMGGPGCTGEWAGGHWEDEVVEDEEDEVAPAPKPKLKPKPPMKAAKNANPFDDLF
jgi:hypothetical protein